MKEEFKLSEKINDIDDNWNKTLNLEDVEEFIKDLKDWIKEYVRGSGAIIEEIDKLAGDLK